MRTVRWTRSSVTMVNASREVFLDVVFRGRIAFFMNCVLSFRWACGHAVYRSGTVIVGLVAFWLI